MPVHVGDGGGLEGSHSNQIRALVNSQIVAINVPFIHSCNVFGGSDLMHLTANVLARPTGRWHNWSHVTIGLEGTGQKWPNDGG